MKFVLTRYFTWKWYRQQGVRSTRHAGGGVPLFRVPRDHTLGTNHQSCMLKPTHPSPLACGVAVADPGFSPGGAPTPKIAIILKIFVENCMKMKEFERIWTPGGARRSRPPWIRQ